MPWGCRSRAITCASPRIANFAGKGRRCRKRFHAGGRTCEDDHAAAARQHRGHDLLRGHKRAKGGDAPGVLECARLGVHQFAERAHRGVVEQHVHVAEFAANLVECRGYVGGLRDVRGDGDRLAAALSISFASALSLSSPRATNATAYSLANLRASAAPRPGPTPMTTQTGRPFDAPCLLSCAHPRCGRANCKWWSQRGVTESAPASVKELDLLAITKLHGGTLGRRARQSAQTVSICNYHR